MLSPSKSRVYGVLVMSFCVIPAVMLVLVLLLAEPMVDPGSGVTAQRNAGGGEAGDTPASTPASSMGAFEEGASEPVETSGATGESAAANVASPAPVAAPEVGGSEPIAVGFLLADLGPVGRAGVSAPGSDAASQRRSYQAFVDDLNGRGGINGRLVEPVFVTFDPLSDDDQRRACLELTVDEKVFAVLVGDGLQSAGQLCVAHEKRVPLFTFGGFSPEGWHRRAGGRLITLLQGGGRSTANMVHALERAGVFRGRKIGVLDDARPGTKETVDAGIVTTLARFGHSVTHRATFSADLSTGGSQVPVAVQQMRSKGVEVILLATHLLYTQPFVQAAEQQGYRPQYGASDWAAATRDVSTANMPAGFDGAIGITTTRVGEHRTARPEPALDASCRAIYERRTGTTMARADAEVPMFHCSQLRTFAAAATAAGVPLTQDRFSAALQSLGPLELAFQGPGSYGSGKWDAADFVRTVRWAAACRCWKPADEFRRSDV